MSLRIITASASRQQLLAAAQVLVLLLTGFSPFLHHHESSIETESACQEVHSADAPHLEILELEHHEPCGNCARTFSTTSFDRPSTASLDVVFAGETPLEPQLLPESPPRQYGASRAPPSA